MRSIGPNRPRLGTRPLADLVGAAIGPVLARQGFGQADIILYWDEIVGARLASACEPVCLRWRPRGRNNREDSFVTATLTIRVESGFALELQHLAGVVIERVNNHLGFACVERISLKQGPLARRTGRKPVHDPSAETALTAAAAHVAGISDEALRLALTRLGARVLESTLSQQAANDGGCSAAQPPLSPT